MTMNNTTTTMKTIPIGTPGWKQLSNLFFGLDAAKAEAQSFAKSILRGGSFTPEQLTIMRSPCGTKWAVACRKESAGKRVNRARDMVKNSVGYRLKPSEYAKCAK